jgi:hypothetical protein
VKEPSFWLQVSETELRLLRRGIVSEAVQQTATMLLRPMTRTDDNVTTYVFTRDRQRHERRTRMNDE